jgi:hypothetical protein
MVKKFAQFSFVLSQKRQFYSFKIKKLVPDHRGRFLNQVQVENLQVANLSGINLFTSSLELAKFTT